ncbi:hypothetical protein CHS0354_000385 [Potamilus streckersoni]|uniref:N-glycosylase/DNA lyase n=1 Tax=Potamilus streckersoni TaxID=2493646 RepID=A0AAE0SM43_9BIVA|nr:hypothetical protein CHS0354_000385 [Potamilus streckersoni]
MAAYWRSMPLKNSELRLDRTLACGQSFRWKETQTGEWTGVLGGLVWTLKQTATELFFRTHPSFSVPSVKQEQAVTPEPLIHKGTLGKNFTKKEAHSSVGCVAEDLCDPVTVKSENADLAVNSSHNEDYEHSLLEDYFQLHVDLGQLYQTWAQADLNFAQTSQKFSGIRILRQDPVECLFSFICSSNNNISRITAMVNKLCSYYGKKIVEVEGIPYFSFPTVSALADDSVERTLRELGFGYRAKFISQTAQYIMTNHSENWLLSLRDMDYDKAKDLLMKLPGVGGKVADCVCLFSLDKTGAIPIDTHVWKIAARDYMPKLRQAKSLTDRLYQEIGDHFRSLWGEYAGWTHSVLFTADLRHFQETNDKGLPAKKEILKRSNKLAVEKDSKCTKKKR